MGRAYEDLITPKRSNPSSSGDRSIEIESESEKGRIIFSGPFRRLQRKAQVFPLEDVTPVRTRLTHSLEVAHIGRYLAQAIIRGFRERNMLEKLGLINGRDIAFVNLVETGCLVHDIGNPPYGHFGEYAIKDWFKHNGIKIFKKAVKCHKTYREEFTKKQFQDFVKFDGNAQGFRVLTKLQGLDGVSGYNLTYSQLATYLKYVVAPHQIDKEHPFKKKPGYFYSELNIIDSIRKHLKINDNKRFPLAYIVEAADDIAYCISDIEDGLDKGILIENHFKQKLKDNWNEKVDSGKDYTNYLPEIIDRCWTMTEPNRIEPFVKFKTTLINEIVRSASKRYVDEHDAFLTGEAESLIRKNTKEYFVLKSLKCVVIKELYTSRSAQDIELSGHSVVNGLLEFFSRLLECPREDFNSVLQGESRGRNIGSTDLEKRLLNLLTKKHLYSYNKAVGGNSSEINEWYYRAHLIVDYISCMTDNYAFKTFQLLSGIRID